MLSIHTLTKQACVPLRQSDNEKALRLGAADLSGLEAQSTSHEYEALRETIPKRHRTTSIRKGSDQSMNESRIQE